MTDFPNRSHCRVPFGTLIERFFCHRTALRLYSVINIQPLRGCNKISHISNKNLEHLFLMFCDACVGPQCIGISPTLMATASFTATPSEGIAMYTAGGAVTDGSSVCMDFGHLFRDTYPTALLNPYERRNSRWRSVHRNLEEKKPNERFGLNQGRKIQKMARCVQKKTSIRKNVVSLQNKKENNNTKQ